MPNSKQIKKDQQAKRKHGYAMTYGMNTTDRIEFLELNQGFHRSRLMDKDGQSIITSYSGSKRRTNYLVHAICKVRINSKWRKYKVVRALNNMTSIIHMVSNDHSYKGFEYFTINGIDFMHMDIDVMKVYGNLFE